MNYYLGVNDDIRGALLDALQREGITQAELAKRLGVPRQNVNRAIRGDTPQGRVPPLWARMLEELKLELTVKPVTPAPQAGAEAEGE